MLVTLIKYLSLCIKRAAKWETSRLTSSLVANEASREKAYERESKLRFELHAAYVKAKFDAEAERVRAVNAINDKTSKALVQLSELSNI